MVLDIGWQAGQMSEVYQYLPTLSSSSFSALVSNRLARTAGER